MRGKRVPSVGWNKEEWITPAYAGKTVDLDSDCGDAWDHPRVCGENQDFPFLYLMDLGSPPRMRGKQVNCEIKRAAHRITPAYAGKTFKFPQNPIDK